MSSSNSQPAAKDDAKDEMPLGPQKAVACVPNYQEWFRSQDAVPWVPNYEDWVRSEDAVPWVPKYRDSLEPSHDGTLNDLNPEDLLTGRVLEAVKEVAEKKGKKRLFVCCDGTWLNASGTVAPLSNVAKLARSVNREGADPVSIETIGGVPQLVYYSSGIGTQSTLGMDSSIAAATGKGIRHAIRDAYCFLSNNYNGVSNKDEIILVGFSRGAFTVRCLAEFISRVGLLRRHALPFLPVFFRDWVRGDDKALERRLHGTNGPNGLFYDDPKIKILAEWDPVGSLGIPCLYKSRLQDRVKAQTVPNKVEHAFLALALDEKRWSFLPSIWRHKTSATTTVSQCAFLGHHGDVGGGHPDPGLSTISLLWMVSKIQSVCKADFQMYALFQFNTPIPATRPRLSPLKKGFHGVQNLANTKGKIHPPSRWWYLPHQLTFGTLFNGKRVSIIHDLAAHHKHTGCDLEVHRTVRLLKEKRNFSTGPLHEVDTEPNGRYKWTLKDNPHLPIYEQSLSVFEEQLLATWKVEASMWQRGATRKNEEERPYHNWPDYWNCVTNNEAWGFEGGGSFEESLIKEVCDGQGGK